MVIKSTELWRTVHEASPAAWCDIEELLWNHMELGVYVKYMLQSHIPVCAVVQFSSR